MRSAWKSDTGLRRENNEDFVLADEAHGVFLLADGMGGGPAGEVASRVAVTAAHRLLVEYLPDRVDPTIPRVLAEAVAAAHSAVAKRGIDHPSFAGMGTTLEVVVVRGAQAFICHVGDSRVYLYRQGNLSQLTYDHNYAAMLVKNGMTTVREIPPRFRHVLTQAVGLSDEIVPQLRSVDLKPGDQLLICSDGLNEALDDEEVAALVARYRDDQEAMTRALVAAANAGGGPDNISVLVIEPVPAVAGGTPPDIPA